MTPPASLHSATTRVTNVPKVGSPRAGTRALPPASVTVRCAAGYMLENPVNPPLLV
jgi:hypothetical protein